MLSIYKCSILLLLFIHGSADAMFLLVSFYRYRKEVLMEKQFETTAADLQKEISTEVLQLDEKIMQIKYVFITFKLLFYYL